jgi:hypothetical protein
MAIRDAVVIAVSVDAVFYAVLVSISSWLISI